MDASKELTPEQLECLVILIQNGFDKSEKLKNLFSELNKLKID